MTYDDNTGFEDESNDIDVFGNIFLGTSSYTRNGEIVSNGVGDVELNSFKHGWREIITETGISIEFERGLAYHYAVLDESGPNDPDLDTDVLDGASGNNNANILTANSHSRSVTISGGGGNDIIVGGNADDHLAGDEGADTIEDGGGNDILYVQGNRVWN